MSQREPSGPSKADPPEEKIEARPYSPIYPKLDVTPPPYPTVQTQMPLMYVHEGVMDMSEVGGEEYRAVRHRLRAVGQDGIATMKELTRQIEESIVEAKEETSRVIGEHIESRERQRQGRPLLMEQPKAQSTPVEGPGWGTKEPHPSSQQGEEGFADRHHRQLTEELNRGQVVRESDEEEEEEEHREGDQDYPASFIGTLTVHTEHTFPHATQSDSPYALRSRDKSRAPHKMQMPLIYKGAHLGPTDVGHCSHIAPITFEITDHTPIWQTQYSHKPEAETGIADTIEGLLAAGVLEPSQSPWNTPILPIEKHNTGKYRMAHDLRRINIIVSTPTVPVPNPYTAMSVLTPDHKWFSCIDLANAFFCLPLAEHLRDIFSFSYKGRKLRYTRVPQGFILSPGIFNQVLKQQLADFTLPKGVVSIQYMDDILLAAPDHVSCLEATKSLLMRLYHIGFKVSRAKLQCCRQTVSFLGRVISVTGTGVSPSHRSSILHHVRPSTVKDMLSFLGLTGYSRHFIASYGELTSPLRAMVNEQGMRNLSAKLHWTTTAEESFISLKQSLTYAADLAVPDYTDPFFLDVSEKLHTVNGVLFQKKGGCRQVLMYISVTLDPTEDRHPPCTRHAAGVAKILQKVAHIVMGYPLTVLTIHSIVAFVNSTAFTMTSLRQTRLEKILNAPHITFTHEGINMADNMGEGEPHRCEERVQRDIRVRADLQAKPITDPEETLFTDGCCYRHPTEGLKAAYAVIRQTEDGFEEVLTGTVEGKESAQLAELQAMVAALEWAEGKRVNIYTDSAYVVGAIQVELSQWIRAGFFTAAKTPIKHEKDIKRLAEALMKPAEIAVIKCRGHDKAETTVAKGNQEADSAAKKAAGYTAQNMMIQSEKTVYDLLPACDLNMLIKEQQKASPQELTVWKERGAKESEGVWRSPDGRPVLPPGLIASTLHEAHGLTHCGKTQMQRHLTHWWHPFLPAMIENHIRECKTCTEYNVRATVKPHEGKFPLPQMPGQEIVIDYTDMIERVNGYRYLLVAVDAYTGWPEAMPAKKEDAKTVIKFLINHYIPTYGFPKRIRSDNGTHFKNKDLQEVEAALGLKHAFGAVYHPQSQGKVERMNQSIKGKIGKVCAQTKLSWVDALPLALMSLRSSVNSITGFTPYELKTGQQFPGPGAGVQMVDRERVHVRYKPYYDQLTALVSAFSKQVGAVKGDPERQNPPTTDWVLLKVIKRKWSEPRWTGPFKVVERTSHALRLQGKGDSWYHWSQCAATDPPIRTLDQIRQRRSIVEH
ncbi:uncharacterized protein LOC133990154 [Scomber scombrus]|uniref:uncharacterized protein LOC133990154 n=1 Tax=Scomber scombrus TaxID=13677 RepID=UPI002DD7D80C|nr:uncharacterized protein LOC133990154 [Scomber scombrus]